MRDKTNRKTTTKIRLTGAEVSELIFEGIVTFLILLALEIALILLLNQGFIINRNLDSSVSFLRDLISIHNANVQFWGWNQIFLLILVVIDVLVVYWRIMRRFHQIEMRHVISELHYIADNHFDHRITFKVNPELEKVVSSINALVDSTNRSIGEERRIEKSKDELITNVSHDIRTPLTSIIGYLGLIEDKQFKNQAELLKYTHTAFEKSKQMKVLVDDLFEFTKIQQTATTLNYMSTNMTNMLAQLAASYELEAQKQKIHILTQTRPDPLIMDADPEKLSRVFNNLIINAFKYGQDATKLLLRARQVGTEVIIQVTNNGQPIPEASLAHLFDRFYRVESSRSHETGGSGLGLAIAQSIVALHGGFIYAVSDKTRTSFVIHLPLKRGARLRPSTNVKTTDQAYLSNLN
ncbi:sensor histidine kinase [Agrilactobacillus fermenti]|uniref:sensor histidine kinase n=1 Tax=Agrilactobacillus fermenti TaxID=2586909 RepID=UPI001E581C36|nr:HAMP domain-containing sensor histidine kinase [Agrilactobacillus fermenti]